MSTENQNGDDKETLLRAAMQEDEEITALKEQLVTKLKSRSEKLDKLQELGLIKFAWKGIPLTIFRRGKGLWSLRGKRKELTDLFSID